MKWLLSKFIFMAAALCLSACTVVSVTSREYVNSIGNEAYDIGWANQYEIYCKDGVYYARVPLQLAPERHPLISVETLSISSEGSHHRFSYPQYGYTGLRGVTIGDVYVKVRLVKLNPRHSIYEEVATLNSDSAPKVLSAADFEGMKPILRLPSMRSGSQYDFSWDYGYSLYENKRSWLHYALYPVQGVCVLLDVSLSIALSPVAFLLYDIGPL